jgi:hypothetical protein
MNPELEAKITELLDHLIADANALEHDARGFGLQILDHLCRINSTLSAIDRNLGTLEKKE